MKITEKHLNDLKIFSRVEIYDENYYSWILTLNGNFLTISYGKTEGPLEYDAIPFSSNTEKFLVKLNTLSQKAKIFFDDSVSNSLYMKTHYAN